MDKRLSELEDWLATALDEAILAIVPASSDASFRRYFRVTTANNSYVAMDAPTDKEPVKPFIAIDAELLTLDVHAPKIHQQNIEGGFLLLEDLGNELYLPALNNQADLLYSDAIKALLKIQAGINTSSSLNLPDYSRALLNGELDLFDDWYLKRHLDIGLSSQQKLIWQDIKEFLINDCLQQPQVWVHRDYHSRNLMIVEHNSPAVIDFQSMVVGPIGYDLASLFKDCYITWPRQQQHQWLANYFEKIKGVLPQFEFSFEQLVRWVDLCGLQRHLKVLGIFCRLNYRDGKPAYLEDLPMVKDYIFEVLPRYPELDNFYTLFKQLHLK